MLNFCKINPTVSAFDSIISTVNYVKERQVYRFVHLIRKGAASEGFREVKVKRAKPRRGSKFYFGPSSAQCLRS